MALFDFLKKNSNKSNIDLSDFKFLSNNHVRYQNGNQVGDDNTGAWRGIRIQSNNLGNGNFTVTMYNMDGNHPIWGNNIQMAPKPMKIIESNSSNIRLKGFGNDQMGNSFADYGITLQLKRNQVDKIILHMFDRNIDILYMKAGEQETLGKQEKLNKGEEIPTPSSNIFEVIKISQVIQASNDLSSLQSAYSRHGSYSHSHTSYCFGVSFLLKGQKQLAKEALLKGAHFGIKFPCSLYDTPFIDSVGQCLAYLMINFSNADTETSIKATELAYLYLSRCIELEPREAHDSYRTRGVLFSAHKKPVVIQSLIMANIGFGVLKEPFMISDFYFASQASRSPHQKAYDNAKQIHYDLEDISIGGKDADDYTLKEMAEFGEKRHSILFKTLEKKYSKGELDITFQELLASVE